MKPKQKAKELVDKFKYHSKPITLGMNFNDINHTKQCALVCVDEMIKLCWKYDECESYDWKYYNEVKKEINNL